MDSGLVPKAIPKGNGRGAGQSWFYPSGTDEILDLLYQLQDAGYRGGELHFTLWWAELRPLSLQAVRYVERILRVPKKLAMRPIERRSRDYPKYVRDALELPSDQLSEPPVDEVFGQVLGDMLTKGPDLKKAFAEVLEMLLPGSVESLTQTNFEEVFTEMSEFVSGISLQEDGSSNGDVFQFFKLVALASGNKLDPSDRIFTELGTRHGFERFVGFAEIADADLYRKVRRKLKEDPSWQEMLFQSIEFERGRKAKMSQRKKARQGPWKKIPMAATALFVGTGVCMAEHINSVGLDGERTLGLAN